MEMEYFRYISWCFLYLINLKELHTAKIYLIEVPNANLEETIANIPEENYFKNYEDYNILTDYEDYKNNYKHEHAETIPDVNIVNVNESTSMCHRLFGNEEQVLRCLLAMTDKETHFDTKRQAETQFHAIPLDAYVQKLKELKKIDTQSETKPLLQSIPSDTYVRKLTKLTTTDTETQIQAIPLDVYIHKLKDLTKLDANNLDGKTMLQTIPLDAYVKKLKERGDNEIKLYRIPLEAMNQKQNQASRQHNRYVDFSQDYLDVKDLERSDFADDYLDVTELRNGKNKETNCKLEYDATGKVIKTVCPPSRRSRTKLNIETSLESESSLSADEKLDILRKKPKRYKVVSHEKSGSGKSSSDMSDIFEPNKDSGSSFEESSGSIEVTTKKPKKNKKGKNKNAPFQEKYSYLQGNKYYSNDDFRRRYSNLRRNSRRGYRMSHFLPKRIHWDEDQYYKLGYFWFNGPRGKYMKYESK